MVQYSISNHGRMDWMDSTSMSLIHIDSHWFITVFCCVFFPFRSFRLGLNVCRGGSWLGSWDLACSTDPDGSTKHRELNMFNWDQHVQLYGCRTFQMSYALSSVLLIYLRASSQIKESQQVWGSRRLQHLIWGRTLYVAGESQARISQSRDINDIKSL